MVRVRERLYVMGILLLLGWVSAACGPAGGSPQVSTESTRDGVFAIQDGARESLPAPGEAVLAQGDGIDVDATGRALVRFEDLLTVELLRDGELTLQELSADEQSAFVTVAQRGGVLVNDFSASEDGG